MTRLREQGIDLRAESTRLDYIEERLRGDRAAALVREVARTTGWEAVRSSVAPGSDRWWWYLDEEVSRRRKATLRRRLTRAGAILLALVLLLAAYERFLAPSPETQQKIALTQAADQHVESGDLDQAIAKYEDAAALDPADPEVQLWLGVLYGEVGRPIDATGAFQAARQYVPSLVEYFLFRSRIYLQLGVLDKAGNDIRAALSLDPVNTQGLFLLADLLDKRGNYREATDLFQLVSLEAEDPALQVLAKVRFGMLLEAGPRVSTSATVTGTVTIEDETE
jgi:tetratricopeptide (TPR) repeat protein